jgi:uncharacterized protein (TIGR02147 family)
MNQNQSLVANDFRIFLEEELGRRSATNPTYSLRAFARDLGVDSSFLSKLLNGKRSMTARTIIALAARLSLPEDEVQKFVANSNGKRRRFPLSPLQAEVLHEIENQKLMQLMEWYHFAVLELFQVTGFNHEPAWISERLGISVDEATRAFEDLVAAEVIVKQADGAWKRVGSNHMVSSKRFPRAHAVKKQIYEQAIALLPESIGDHSTVTVSVSEGRLREAFERIRKFRRELSQFLAEPPEKEDVYQLIISLFPASKKKSSAPPVK